MKYILIVWVCSFLGQSVCMEPIEGTTPYNSWYECARAAHMQSIRIYSRLGYKYVNENKIATRYTCTTAPSSI